MSLESIPMPESRMLSGTPVLMGDNTIPGIHLHKELKPLIPKIEEACRNFGLDYYPIIIEIVTYSDMAELASYGGFPNRYPHWQFGMEYEEMSRGYEYGQYRISEMVINSLPCRIYCMDSNTLVDNIDVIAHAIGHNDFFKNNVFFEKTNLGMVDKMACHGSRIRKYMRTWGDERVTEFIDHVLRIQTLIDPASAWKKKEVKPMLPDSERKYHYPNRIKGEHNYMDPWLNNPEYTKKEKERVSQQDAIDQLDLFKGSEKDIFAYLKDNAVLKPWQQDVVSMLYEEAIYFAPQRQTKMLNEGWASFVDNQIMCREGLVALGQKSPDCGIIHYAEHKMKVLGGKYSQNPYKTGFELLLDIEDRWNKGRFGPEYDTCQNMHERRNWNKNLGLGKEKIFEVRKTCNDFTAILEYFTPELCEKLEYYEYEHFPNGEYQIVSTDFKQIKKRLLERYLNGGLPDIRLIDPNHLNRKWFLMEHQWDGRPLYDSYVKQVLTSIYFIWGHPIVLCSKTPDAKEYVYICDGVESHDVQTMYRQEYEEKYM